MAKQRQPSRAPAMNTACVDWRLLSSRLWWSGSRITALRRWSMGSPLLRPSRGPFTPQTTDSFRFLSNFTLASVADPRLFVSVTTKHKSLHWACNRHLPMVGLPTVYWSGWKNRTWWFLSSSSGFTPWPQWNGRSFFQDHLWAIWV